MYRTEEYFKELKNHKLKTPICIPSYHRPDAPIFNSNILKSIPKDNLFVFIRNDKEQIQLYSKLADKVNLVTLPEVHDLGDTRMEIVNWAVEHKYSNIFMLDDTTVDLRVLQPKRTKNNTIGLDKAGFSSPIIAFLIWEYLQNKHNPTISCVSTKGFSWYPENIDKPYTVHCGGGLGNCINIDIEDLMKNDINYKSTEEAGCEDAYLIYRVLNAGLATTQFTDLDFSIKDNSKIKEGSGSSKVYGNNRVDRLMRLKELFYTNTLGVPFGTKVPGFILRKSKKEKLIIGFNWKYWREYYKKINQ